MYKKKFNKKITFIKYFVIIIFLFIIYSFYDVCINNNKKYSDLLIEKTKTIIYGDTAPRGRIYDRNYKLLVDNKSYPVIIYKKSNNITSNEEIELAKKISKKIDVDYKKLSLINLKEFWIIDNSDLANKKITSEEWTKLKNRKIDLEDIKNLQLDRITDEDLSIYDDSMKKVAYIFYLMNKGYFYEEKIIKDESVSDLEFAYIAENITNLNGFDVTYKWERVYPYGNVFREILGNVSSITYEDKDDFLNNGYSLSDYVGVSYIEKEYENILKGKKEVYELSSGNKKVISSGKRGNDIVLTIDIELQKEVEKILSEEVIKAKKEGSTEFYNRSYVVIQEPFTGEILAMSGKQVVKNNGNYKVYDVTSGILTNPMTVGSVVKGASMTVGYTNNAIKIGDVMYDSCIKIYNKPEKCSWKNLGSINDLDALAYSSNIYQFKTAMKVDGFKYSYNKKYEVKKDTFDKYRSIFNQFGLGVKTEIDLPIESVGNVGNDYSSDLFLNFTIGQYDTYTPIQLSQYVTTIASNGNRYKPHLLKEIHYSSDNSEIGKLKQKIDPLILNKVDTKEEYIKRVQKGFRSAVTYGIAGNIMGNSPKAAGKTGTSESFLDTDNDGVIDTETVSSTFVGYAPYDNPVMTITVTSPDLVNPNSKSSSISYANHRITRLISNKFFDLYKK